MNFKKMIPCRTITESIGEVKVAFVPMNFVKSIVDLILPDTPPPRGCVSGLNNLGWFNSLYPKGCQINHLNKGFLINRKINYAMLIILRDFQ